MRNSGNVSNTPDVQLGGAAAGDFVITSNGCAGRSIGAGATCTVSVEFVPTDGRSPHGHAVDHRHGRLVGVGAVVGHRPASTRC